MSTLFLSVQAVSTFYGSVPILKNVSVDLARGESLAIVGPNGAGKTTFFKSVSGELAPRSGTVHFDGEECTSLAVHERVKRGIGRTFQVARVFPNDTVIENVLAAIEIRDRNAKRPSARLFSDLHAPQAVKEAEAMLDSLGLAGDRDQRAGFLSHGDKKRLELGMVLALRPRLLLMDEPTAGMSPPDRAETVKLLTRLRADHDLTIMLTDHDMDVVFGLADRIMVLNYGEVIAVGSPAEIKANKAVREIYLGEATYRD